jgi:hypothetical protein
MNEEQSIVKNSVKPKIVFAFLMGIVTTGLVSFTVVLVNLGLTEAFWQIWLKSWAVAYFVIVPIILIVSPVIERFVGFLFKLLSTKLENH